MDLTDSSGETSEKQLEVFVHLPADVSYDCALKAFIVGTLGKEEVVNATYGSCMYTVTFSGKRQQELTVELNGTKYRVYAINFDAGEITLQESYLYVDDTPSQPESSAPVSEDPFTSEPDPLLPITPSDE